jgi:hypothetical protein
MITRKKGDPKLKPAVFFPTEGIVVDIINNSSSAKTEHEVIVSGVRFKLEELEYDGYSKRENKYLFKYWYNKVYYDILPIEQRPLKRGEKQRLNQNESDWLSFDIWVKDGVIQNVFCEAVSYYKTVVATVQSHIRSRRIDDL